MGIPSRSFLAMTSAPPLKARLFPFPTGQHLQGILTSIFSTMAVSWESAMAVFRRPVFRALEHLSFLARACECAPGEKC